MAVLAVDPSSRRSGGALLGDRARIDADPEDRGLFIRSMAAGERLGGLAPATRSAAQALAAAFDVVVVETVGVGQSETDVAGRPTPSPSSSQPGAGDALQFLKAGIMEVPDVLVVTKADLGAVAQRAVRDLRTALRSLGAGAPVLAVSALPPAAGVEALADALAAHRAALDLPAARARAAPPRGARRLHRRARRGRPPRARRTPRGARLPRHARARPRLARARPRTRGSCGGDLSRA